MSTNTTDRSDTSKIAAALRALPRYAFRQDESRIPGRKDAILPVPWIVEIRSGKAIWTTFIPERSNKAHRRRRCQVCGLVVKGTMVHLDVGQGFTSESNTSGPGCHPLCAMLAIRLCPHFAGAKDADDQTRIGWTWDRPGQGYGANGDRIEDLLGGDAPMRDGVVPITMPDLSKLVRDGADADRRRGRR